MYASLAIFQAFISVNLIDISIIQGEGPGSDRDKWEELFMSAHISDMQTRN